MSVENKICWLCEDVAHALGNKNQLLYPNDRNRETLEGFGEFRQGQGCQGECGPLKVLQDQQKLINLKRHAPPNP